MALSEILNEGKNSQAERAVNELIEKLKSLDWYSKVGQYSQESRRETASVYEIARYPCL